MNTSGFVAKDHDLSVPAWGPYGKQYAGISHVADRGRGLRFDLSVFPALYRRRIDVPNVNWESAYHPWECAPSFEYFSFRHELMWKDQLYADISYSKLEGVSGALVRCEFVNKTKRPYTTALHFMASLHFPSPWPYSSEPIRTITVTTPEGSILRHPLDYETIDFAKPAPADHLVTDGYWRGEVRGQDFLDGSALGGRFGRDAGDRAHYRFSVATGGTDWKLVVRARVTTERKAGLAFSGLSSSSVEWSGTEFIDHELPVGVLAAGDQSLIVTATGGAPVQIVFLALVPASGGVTVESRQGDTQPQRLTSPTGQSLVLKYDEAPAHYGIAWEEPGFEVRQILSSELDSFLRYKAHDHVNETLRGDERGHYTNVFQRPILVEAGATKVLWGLVCEGDLATVNEALRHFSATAAEREEQVARARKKSVAFKPDATGKKYLFSQQRMAATTLSNIIFPAYTQRQYIKHRCPGRWWDCLYTWDSGFIGLGLVELDTTQAVENLAQYVTNVGNPHAAFIHHGSMVPMQIHLYHELWNRTQSRKTLETYYASLRQYYLFYAGHAGGSTMRNLKSNLLRSWDYFYNSGGWDDYEPQKYMHQNGLASRTTAVINSAQAIRCARTLAMAAAHLGRTEDLALYEKDIADISRDLNAHSWDAEAGYYSYVVHDSDGKPAEILRHASGENFNRGLDGAFPLTAGVCDRAQEEALVAHLFDPKQLWSRIGLSAIDQSAAYYRPDGYWNGTVWFPHQWFFWKTMLDLDRADLAVAIAERALETWRDEVDESYNCFEHFVIDSGRGCGWHHFSGLSTPVLAFFAACHCAGRLTLGFESWVLESRFSDRNSRFAGRIILNPRRTGDSRAVLVSLNPKKNYTARWNGTDVAVRMIHPGLLAISLPATGTAGALEIDPV